MITILQLPDEILLTILDYFDPLFDLWELTECQYVCRAWYHYAHLKVLKCVTIHGSSMVKQFIACIDSNPNPEYLKAVQRLRINNNERCIPPEQHRLSKENITKLFFRFPNLQDVEVDGNLVLLDNFDDELCKAFWKACPKLEKFEVEPEYKEDNEYREMLLKLRYLLTKLHVRDAKQTEGFKAVQDFITSFPCLRDVGDLTGRLDTFRRFLPIFEQLPYLKRLTICARGVVNINYTDAYLANHRSAIDTLSNITHLDLYAWFAIEADSLYFIKKYLTGLLVLSVNHRGPTHWSDNQQRLFCNNTLDLLPFVKNFTQFCLWIDFNALTKCLPTIIQKVFRQIPPPYTNKAKRILRIELSNLGRYNPQDMATLHVEVWRLEKRITIAFNDAPSLDDVTSDTLSECEPIQDVDLFQLDIEKRGQLDSYDCETTMEMYNSLLRRMPSLKEVILGIPISFVETEPSLVQCNVLPKVEVVTLKATADAKFQTLLDGFFYSFPNIKRLNICYFSGIWKKDMGEFHLDLPRYELETLVLDVTTVRRKMKENAIDKECFVLEIEFISNSRRYMYVVSTEDLSFDEMTSMNDLNGFIRGKDYYRVNIKVNKLQTLKLWINDENTSDEREEYIYTQGEFLRDQVTIFTEDDEENWLLFNTNKDRDTTLLY